MRFNIMLAVLLAFAAGQFAELRAWSVVAIVALGVFATLIRIFQGITRLEKENDPPAEVPVPVSQPAERDGETEQARVHAGMNGGRHGAHNA